MRRADDGEAAVEDESTTVLWVLLSLSTVMALVLSAVRAVPRGHRLVATRRGIVSRVAGPGLFVRLPVAERVIVESSEPEQLPLAVHATTRDGTDVRLLATALVRVPPPDRNRPYVDGRRAGGEALEGVLAEEVRAHGLAELPDVLARRWTELTAAAVRVGRGRGLEVLGLELDELDALLTPPVGRGPD